ncbi:MAG: hypothetical protein NTX53_14905 [candidate division WOR-3 bacterium]|nr:hypothetical protein [candidate division WOR-3 bacterium]
MAFGFVLVHASPLGVPCQTLIVSDGISTVYPVEHGFLIPGTDTVYMSGRRLDPADYTLDYNTGYVIFWRRPEKWTPIRVTYRCVTFPGQQKEYRLRQLPVSSDQSPVAESSAVLAVEPSLRAADSTGLDLSGNKTLGVSFGGGDAGIDQATRVAITGSVEGIAVDAELSDQSSPIPAEGTTRDIDELDKLLINLRGEQWRGSFGDVDLRVPVGGFGAIERKAVGATAGWGAGRQGTMNDERGTMNEGPGVGLYAGYASPKGLFGRVELTGVDGSQGPYVLAPDGRAAQIVPGSEEVYLNSSRMVRGWDADYTIDYSTGEVLFTNRRVIDQLSRIEATFQYVTGDYSRAVVVGGANVGVRGRGPGVGGQGSGADLSVGLFREGDDASRNFMEDLTPEEQESLAAIGGDTTRAWLDGATYAGAGKGDYVKSGDHYVYAGRDSGDYQVRFTLVGDSLGDYRYNDTILAYSFAGPRGGNYVAKRRIALPQRNEAAHARLGLKQQGFNVGLEGLFQRRDLNLFAPGGAPDDAGALGLDIGWQDSSYGVNYRHRLQGARFEVPGASPAIDFTYRWAGTPETELHSSDEVSVRAKPVAFLSLGGEAGRLDRFNGGPVERYQGSAQVGWLGYDVTRVADITRQNVLAAPHAGWFYPKAGWQTEVDSTEKSSVWLAGMEVKPVSALTAGVDYHQSGFYEPDSIAGVWRRTSRGRLAEARADWTSGTAFRLGAMAGLNDRHFDSGTDEDWNQLLASLSGSATPRAGLRMQADFNQSYRKVQLKDELFRYVGPGEGTYRRDSVTGGYVPDADGDYERVVVATGRFAQAREWSLNGSGDVSMFDPAALSGSFSQTRTSTDTAVLSELSRQDLRLVVNALEPAVTPTLGANSEFSADRTLAATGRASSHQQVYLEFYSDRVPGIEGRARAETDRTLRRLGAGDIDFDETGWRVQASPIIGTRLRLEAELGYEQKAIAEPVSYPELGRFSLAAVDVSLARTFSFGSRTRVRASVALARRTSSVEALPFDVGLDEPLGISPGAELTFEHSFSDVLSASARYGFQDRPDRASEHRLSAELKAYF